MTDPRSFDLAQAAAQLDDGELDTLRRMVEWTAAEIDMPDRLRLFHLDLAGELHNIANAREVWWWAFEHAVLDPPAPGEPVRVWYPPGWRHPDHEAPGL